MTALQGFLDDAAIFPPGNLPLADAVAAHRRHRRSSYADVVGPLVISVAALSGLSELTVADAAEPLDVAVVVPDATGAAGAIDRTRRMGGVRLVALEVTDTTVPALRAAIGEPDGIVVHVEVPRDERRLRLITDLAGTSYRAKLRTGGVRAELYPDEAELADVVVALVRAGVAFKATAGLHHALRNTDPGTGFEQHGFLNLLAATDAAARGADVEEVAAVLAERDAQRLPALPPASLLESIGTCSITDPVAELAALGVLARALEVSR